MADSLGIRTARSSNSGMRSWSHGVNCETLRSLGNLVRFLRVIAAHKQRRSAKSSSFLRAANFAQGKAKSGESPCRRKGNLRLTMEYVIVFLVMAGVAGFALLLNYYLADA